MNINRLLTVVLAVFVLLFSGCSDLTDETTESTQLMWQDDNNASMTYKMWLTDVNYQTCYDNTQPDGTGGDDPSCHDTSGDTASSYCSDLTLDGYTDWRLPTADELVSSADNNFTYSVDSYYWSSSELETVASSAYMVFFGTTDKSWNGKHASYYVRCIREY